MKIVLDYWNRKWQSVLFDTNTGIGRIRWFSKPERICGGWAYKYNKKWYAVWNSGDNLVFQEANTKIQITKQYKCQLSTSEKNIIFKIYEADIVKFETVYKKQNRKYDLTYDDCDREQEDFFYWLLNLWQDESWKEDAIKNWISFKQ